MNKFGSMIQKRIIFIRPSKIGILAFNAFNILIILIILIFVIILIILIILILLDIFFRD